MRLLELYSQGSQKRFHVGPDGLQVMRGLDVERNVQRIGRCAGEFGYRPPS